MRIKWTTLYVDDQEKALKFYTDKLGFQKKADFSQGNYRWLTVASAEDADGVELVLESNANPAGKAYQQALRGMSQPAANFLVTDVQAEHDRLAVVAEVPAELVAREDPALEGLVGEEPERKHEEDRQPCDPRRQQSPRGEPAVPVEERHRRVAGAFTPPAASATARCSPGC